MYPKFPLEIFFSKQTFLPSDWSTFVIVDEQRYKYILTMIFLQ